MKSFFDRLRRLGGDRGLHAREAKVSNRLRATPTIPPPEGLASKLKEAIPHDAFPELDGDEAEAPTVGPRRLGSGEAENARTGPRRLALAASIATLLFAGFLALRVGRPAVEPVVAVGSEDVAAPAPRIDAGVLEEVAVEPSGDPVEPSGDSSESSSDQPQDEVAVPKALAYRQPPPTADAEQMVMNQAPTPPNDSRVRALRSVPAAEPGRSPTAPDAAGFRDELEADQAGGASDALRGAPQAPGPSALDDLSADIGSPEIEQEAEPLMERGAGRGDASQLGEALVAAANEEEAAVQQEVVREVVVADPARAPRARRMAASASADLADLDVSARRDLALRDVVAVQVPSSPRPSTVASSAEVAAADRVPSEQEKRVAGETSVRVTGLLARAAGPQGELRVEVDGVDARLIDQRIAELPRSTVLGLRSLAPELDLWRWEATVRRADDAAPLVVRVYDSRGLVLLEERVAPPSPPSPAER